MTTSTSTLSDLTELTSHYLQTEVEVRVADVTRNLNPRAEGTYTVKVRNADAPRGIRLHDVTVHIKASSDVAQLSANAPTMLETRAGGSRSEPLLPDDALVQELYVFFPDVSTGVEPNDVLEPGEELAFDMPYRANRRGTAQITAHVHASFLTTDLFPRTNGPSNGKDVTVG